MTVTRAELARHVEAAFVHGPATRDTLLAYAASSHARPATIAVIRDLPDRAYPTIRDLWHDLTEVTVDR